MTTPTHPQPKQPLPRSPVNDRANDTGDTDDGPLGDPADLRDEGVLESLGKAVSSPVRSAAGEEREERPQGTTQPSTSRP